MCLEKVFISHVVKRFVLYETLIYVCMYITKPLLRVISESIFCYVFVKLICLLEN